jgi:hypothetical protein
MEFLSLTSAAFLFLFFLYASGVSCGTDVCGRNGDYIAGRTEGTNERWDFELLA